MKCHFDEGLRQFGRADICRDNSQKLDCYQEAATSFKLALRQCIEEEEHVLVFDALARVSFQSAKLKDSPEISMMHFNQAANFLKLANEYASIGQDRELLSIVETTLGLCLNEFMVFASTQDNRLILYESFTHQVPKDERYSFLCGNILQMKLDLAKSTLNKHKIADGKLILRESYFYLEECRRFGSADDLNSCKELEETLNSLLFEAESLVAMQRAAKDLKFIEEIHTERGSQGLNTPGSTFITNRCIDLYRQIIIYTQERNSNTGNSIKIEAECHFNLTRIFVCLSSYYIAKTTINFALGFTKNCKSEWLSDAIKLNIKIDKSLKLSEERRQEFKQTHLAILTKLDEAMNNGVDAYLKHIYTAHPHEKGFKFISSRSDRIKLLQEAQKNYNCDGKNITEVEKFIFDQISMRLNTLYSREKLS